MEIKITSSNSLYVKIGDYTYYIDDSTNEQIIEKWHNNRCSIIDEETGILIASNLDKNNANELINKWETWDIDTNKFAKYKII